MIIIISNIARIFLIWKKTNYFNLTTLFLFFNEPPKTSRRVFFQIRCFWLFRDTIGSINFGKIVVASSNYRFIATVRAMLARFHILVDRFFFTQETYITNARFNKQSTGTEARYFRSTFFQSGRSSMEIVAAVHLPFLENIRELS